MRGRRGTVTGGVSRLRFGRWLDGNKVPSHGVRLSGGSGIGIAVVRRLGGGQAISWTQEVGG